MYENKTSQLGNAFESKTWEYVIITSTVVHSKQVVAIVVASRVKQVDQGICMIFVCGLHRQYITADLDIFTDFYLIHSLTKFRLELIDIRQLDVEL